ncbi:MAG: hydroxymethylglutaryl-CoA lyase [bacterium]
MKIVESPREGMQGFHHVIPTSEKILYINDLLKVGFNTIETGSIVSPKFVPQMADTAEVMRGIDRAGSNSNLMVLVGNPKGAEIACGIPQVTHLSYPFSISPAFLRHNLNVTTEESLSDIDMIINFCSRSGKVPVIYISMAFGNPYGDEWNVEIVLHAVERLSRMGASIIPLSNVAVEIESPILGKIFSALVPTFPSVEFGLHLHTSGNKVPEKISAAWQAGCRRFDSVIGGYGGCPMSEEEMLGNLKTEELLRFAESESIPLSFDHDAFRNACDSSSGIFSKLSV